MPLKAQAKRCRSEPLREAIEELCLLALPCLALLASRRAFTVGRSLAVVRARALSAAHESWHRPLKYTAAFASSASMAGPSSWRTPTVGVSAYRGLGLGTVGLARARYNRNLTWMNAWTMTTSALRCYCKVKPAARVLEGLQFERRDLVVHVRFLSCLNRHKRKEWVFQL